MGRCSRDVFSQLEFRWSETPVRAAALGVEKFTGHSEAAPWDLKWNR